MVSVLKPPAWAPWTAWSVFTPTMLRMKLNIDVSLRSVVLELRSASHCAGILDSAPPSTPLGVRTGATIAGNAVISIDDTHTGEEVIAAASGPGAERVRGFLPNTGLFGVMMAALGWPAD